MAFRYTVELKILGTVSARLVGEPASGGRLTQPRLLALLCYLTLARPRRPHSRDTLMALLWPEADQAAARQGLRNALHRLRAKLGDDVIVTDGDVSAAIDLSRVICDALDFERAVAERRWSEALSHYSGDLLQGFHVGGAPEFDHWLDGERARLRHAAAEAAWSHSAALCEARDLVGAAASARMARELSPDDERSLRRYLDLLMAAGDRTAALRAYHEFAARLETDLGAVPGAETQAAIRAIRTEAREPALPRATEARRFERVAAAPAQLEPSAERPPADPLPRRGRLWARFAVGAALTLSLAALVWSTRSGGAETRATVQASALDPVGAALPAVWRADTTNLRAYLRAYTELQNRPTSAARQAFAALVARDPLYGPGWAGLSVALYRSAFVDMPPQEAMARAVVAAHRALALDSSLADAHETLIAHDLFGEWDLESAKRRLDEAIARYPAHAELYNLLATWYRFGGDLQAAMDVKEKNKERDPLSLRYAWQITSSLYFAHRCSEAESAYRRLPTEIRAARGSERLYRVLACQGKDDEAAVALRQSVLEGGDTVMARLFDPPLTPKRRARAVEAVFRQRLDRALASRRRAWTPPETVMMQYAEMKNADSTLIWLDSMYVERSMMLYVVPFDPLNDFLRDDPRFQAFVQRLPWVTGAELARTSSAPR